MVETEMSYDLSIYKSESQREHADIATTAAFVASIPGIQANGEARFVYAPSADRWMEIDLDYMNAEGDTMFGSDEARGKVNQIDLHIPYAYLTEANLGEYLGVGLRLARHLNWRIADLQTGAEVNPEVDE